MRLGVMSAGLRVLPRPASPALREVLNEGGRAVTLLDGAITVLEPGPSPTR